MIKKLQDKLISTKVIIISCCMILTILVETLFLVYTKKMTRPKGDRITRKFGSSLLNIAQVKRNYIFEHPFKLEPHRCYMIMSNHSSLYDIPLMFEGIPASVRMLTKKELYKIPLFGLTLKTNEFICIDRQNRQQALKDLAIAKEKMHSGIVVWVSPEGTRSRDGALLPFKKGVFHLALETGAMIIPVGIKAVHRVLPAKTWQFSLNETVDVTIGDAIDASNYTEKTRKKLMQVVEMKVRALSNQPL